MEEMKIGVYICHCGINIAATVNVEDVAEYASALPNVEIARNYMYMCSEPGQTLIKNDIIEKKLDRVIVASCSPRMHEPTFRSVCEEAGLNKYCFEMTNIREQCSWVHVDKKKATEKAKNLVASAVAKAFLLEPLKENEVDVIPAALVIGGGIAGIYAALSIADTGYKVYLVENKPSIGGHVAQLSRTFPTLERSACLTAPTMVEIAHHKNIELLTYAEVEEIEGFIGNFKAKIRKKPRYVDEEKCTVCGKCVESCILKEKIPDEFDAGIGKKRAAIYMPFPYAVPATYTVDSENCLKIKEGECGEGKNPPCIDVCEENAINFEQKEEREEIEIGTVIVATGYDVFDANLKPEFGYDLYNNVITSLEFERIASASGPTQGKIIINGKEPKDIVFIQCVGSRDAQIGNEYCSRICCMYTAKQAYLVKKRIPDANVTVCYMDIRAFGKGFEEFYEKVQREGVIYRRGNPGEIYKKGDKLIVRGEDTFLGEPYEIEADLVVLAIGTNPNKDADRIAKMLKLSQSPDRFLLEAHPKLRPVDTAIDGIFLAGCCQSPKDIFDTISQARAAAAAAISPMAMGKVKTEATISEVREEICIGCRSCEEVCAYSALSFDETKKIMVVNEALCKGCGSCASACPSGAAAARHFKDIQIYAQLEALT